MSEWKHDALAEDLAAHLRGYARPAMIWLNMQLGPAASPRPDVYTIEPTYTALRAMAYECKVSRADFLRDVQAGKALGYLNYAGAVTFACPKGMVTKAEIPTGCGLIERSEAGWRWTRKPTIQPLTDLPWVTWMKLVIDGCDREYGRLQERYRARQANEYVQNQRARKLLGDELGNLLADRDAARYRLQCEIQQFQQETNTTHQEREAHERRRRERIERDLAELRAELDEAATLVGLEPGASGNVIISRLRDLRPEGDVDRLRSAENALRLASKTLTSKANAIAECLGTVPA